MKRGFGSDAPGSARSMPAAALQETPIQAMQRLGVEFWNDSCHLAELGSATAQGACGATSNPVIVASVVEQDRRRWLPVLRDLIRRKPRAPLDELAWDLIEDVARSAARLLAPLHDASQGARGWLCAQVNPSFNLDPQRMLGHAQRLARLAPNIAVKVPATRAGIEVMEELAAQGIAVNATVSFTVAQALACAEAMERGGKRRGRGAICAAARGRGKAPAGRGAICTAARGRGKAPAGRAAPAFVTLMVGRLDDHLKRLLERDRPSVDPAALEWAGISVFKKARQLFQERRFKSRLLVAAYRHERHWSELIGPGIIQSIPYAWWTRFNASGLAPHATLDGPVQTAVVNRLLHAFPDFRKAYDERGLGPEEFARYGASAHTLDQFIAGTQKVLDMVRQEMFER